MPSRVKKGTNLVTALPPLALAIISALCKVCWMCLSGLIAKPSAEAQIVKFFSPKSTVSADSFLGVDSVKSLLSPKSTWVPSQP